MNKNYFRTRIFPPLFISFNLKFKSIDDGTLDDRKLSKNIFESNLMKDGKKIGEEIVELGRWKIVQKYIRIEIDENVVSTPCEQEEEYFLL